MDINIVPVEPRYRRRRGSNFWRFVAQLIFFLASLIPMCIIAWRIDLLGLDPRQQPQVVVANAPPAEPNLAQKRRVIRARPEQIRFAPRVDVEAAVPPALVLDGSTQPQSRTRLPATVDGDAVQPLSTLSPIVVPFDLRKRVIRIVYTSENEPPEFALCNIEPSTELNATALNDLPLGSRLELLFDSRINDIAVGVEINFVKRNKLLVLEILPKYRLPSGDEEAFYKQAGVRKLRQLEEAVEFATHAKKAVPRLEAQLGSLRREFESAKSVGNSATVGTRAYIQSTAAQLRADALWKQGSSLEEELNRARAIADQLPRLQSDLKAVQALGKWGADISQKATLSVCIHHDGKSLLVEAK